MQITFDVQDAFLFESCVKMTIRPDANGAVIEIEGNESSIVLDLYDEILRVFVTENGEVGKPIRQLKIKK